MESLPLNINNNRIRKNQNLKINVCSITYSVQYFRATENKSLSVVSLVEFRLKAFDKMKISSSELATINT